MKMINKCIYYSISSVLPLLSGYRVSLGEDVPVSQIKEIIVSSTSFYELEDMRLYYGSTRIEDTILPVEYGIVVNDNIRYELTLVHRNQYGEFPPTP